MASKIDEIILADKDNWDAILELFLKNSLDVFVFPELKEESKRKDIWGALYNIAKCSKEPNVIKKSFIVVRILSREKDHLEELIDDDWINLMKSYAGLDNDKLEFNINNTKICIEVLKCLSNIFSNSPQLAVKSIDNGILQALTKRIINNYSDNIISDEIRFMDMRLLFLITALCLEARKKVIYMIESLIKILEDILKEAAKNHIVHENVPPISLTDVQTELVCEVLKTLFNITLGVTDSDPEVLTNCIILVKILRNYLLISLVSLEKTWTLRNNVINLLTNMPDESYKELIRNTEGPNILKSLEFEGHNMTAVFEILMFLKAKFNEKIPNQHEVLSPVVMVLLKGATSNRAIRKFIRNQILPPLKDVHSKPEQGDTLRNHLCRMLTTPITQLRDLVAELLFVLCKNNVARMIKYTGYGNAAALFAQRGLLAGGRDEGEKDFSSESEDSETEEYANHKHGINPVTGYYEEPHPSVLDKMSDEQKEYEAMKLVELMDNLLKCSTIKPCIVGEDGKQQPVKHVLQLQERLKSQQVQRNDDID